jgi:hypothetical protein
LRLDRRRPGALLWYPGFIHTFWPVLRNRSKHMNFISNSIVTGLVGAATSAVAATAGARAGGVRSDRPINAVSHIAWGGRRPGHRGAKGLNTATGTGLHVGASLLWGSVFEALFGRVARASTGAAVAGAASVATAAFITDYYIVHKRFQPGYEKFLSGRGLFAVYAALAAGYVLAARSGPLRRHEPEDREERDEGRHAESSPGPEAVPEPVRERVAVAARFTG